MRRGAVLASLVLASGCAAGSHKYTKYPENPFPDVRIVAVLPFMNHTGQENVPVDEFGEILASEFLKFRGFRVVRPRAVSRLVEPGREIRSFDEARRIGTRVKADAVVVAAVTDYDPYRPPRLGVSIQFLRIQPREVTDAEIDRIVRSASWRLGPLGMGRQQAGYWMRAFERVYDAHQETVRGELRRYAASHVEGDGPFRGDGEFVAIQSRFMQFVSNQVAHEILALSE